ncbi:MAG: RNA methyltransferase [Acidimicrobiales bacterium]|nr:RNA methyltransferase [Acidimicrobiales bacterium]
MPPLAASNHRIRRLRRLLGRRSARLDEAVFVLEGPTLVGEALDAECGVEAVFVDEQYDDATGSVDRAERAGVAVHLVSAGVLGTLTDVVTPRPILGVATLPTFGLGEVVERCQATRHHLVVLADVRDPGNLGTIIRAAAASGAAGVIATKGTVDPWSPKVVRSSAGAVLSVPIVTGLDLATTLQACAEAEIPTWGTVVGEATAYDQALLGGAFAVVLGNEARGLDRAVDQLIDHRLTIPMEGSTESLNVAMAASVVCFEALRQRRRGPVPPMGSSESDWTTPPGGDKVIGS